VTMEHEQLDVPQLVRDAVERTKDYLTPTPLEFSRYLSDQIEGEVWLKLDLCRRHVNEIMLLTEEEIAASIRTLFEQHRLISEGSGALGVGGMLKYKERFKGKKVVAVVCGRNIDLDVFKTIIS
jgi:threonine dehydratase